MPPVNRVRSVLVRLGFALLGALPCASSQGAADPFEAAFVNFETAPVHPLDLGPDGHTLAVGNLPGGTVELFDVSTGTAEWSGTVSVGLDPVSVRFRDNGELWVVNQISDSISVVDMASRQVVATLDTLDAPADVVFAGEPERAYVACSMPNVVQVFDPDTRAWLTNIVVDGQRPRSMAVSPDGGTVYVAVFESGNRTTISGPEFQSLAFFNNPVSLPEGPYGGINPPPNDGGDFRPPLNPELPASPPAPSSGLIVRKSESGQWQDDNGGDWTAWITGNQAGVTRRVPGWDMPDLDLAAINTTNHVVAYASGLMNLCMAAGVNPASGQVAVVGTEALNEIRFEPNLNGVFVRVQLALVDPSTLLGTSLDLNPHLDYSSPSTTPALRHASIGDPRAVLFRSDGAKGYVAGMGSRNVVVIDGNGQRTGADPIDVGEGPCGLAWDEPRQRLYIYHRFSSSLSVVDTVTDQVIDARPLFDPTPLSTAAGRRHLYDTRLTSGLGQASCASCHVDARMDRLAWDLGDPSGELHAAVINLQGTLQTNQYHPMKGVMITQTLQDIIGHEPFHWRGDRADIEAFNPTFTNLQGAEEELSSTQMRELRDFLAGVRFPPNPFRPLDNSLPTDLELPGHVALGEDQLPAGSPLPHGNALNGLALFRAPNSFCATCHTLPTGLGRDQAVILGAPTTVPTGPNGGHSFPLAPRLEGALPSKISQLRNLAERVGMNGSSTASPAGFGFGHDGSIDTLTRFLNGARIHRDQDVADLIALLLALPGADIQEPGALPDTTPPAATGRQLTLSSPIAPPLFQAMLDLARSPTGRVELVAKGLREGAPRGWWFDAMADVFQSDRAAEALNATDLLASIQPGSPLTFTLVPEGTGRRVGIDRDLDGLFDRDEADLGTSPSDIPWRPRIRPLTHGAPVGTDLLLEASIPPLPAPGVMSWWKDGTPIPGATNQTLLLAGLAFDAAGAFEVRVQTAFLSYTSAPVTLSIVPLLVHVSPAAVSVSKGSNTVLNAEPIGVGPFAYQWNHQDLPIPGATQAMLELNNVQVSDEGAYSVRVSNTYGVLTSQPSLITVLERPSVILPAVPLAVVPGADATFSFLIAGNPPPFGYILRKSSTIVTNYVSDRRAGFLTVFDVQASDTGTYQIIVTNAAIPPPGLGLPGVTLSLLPDGDGDGMPDAWEMQHDLDPGFPGDAGLDADMDGVNNGDEYRAGTNPQDATSYLRIERIAMDEGGVSVVLEFEAAAGVTYSVQALELSPPGTWRNMVDVAATTTNRVITVADPVGEVPTRWYRLVTPQTP